MIDIILTIMSINLLITFKTYILKSYVIYHDKIDHEFSRMLFLYIEKKDPSKIKETPPSMLCKDHTVTPHSNL